MLGAMPIGLRERKKQQMREAIVDAALKLFARRGYDATTVAGIAEAVDISPRTFFGYFPSKEDVVFHDFHAVFDRFEASMAGRSERETTLDVLRAFVEGMLEEMDHGDPAEQCRRRVIAGSEALQQRDREFVGRFERVLAENLARDLGVDPDSPRARVVAAAAAAALTELEHVLDKENMPEDPLATFDEVFDFVRGGVAELQRHSPR